VRYCTDRKFSYGQKKNTNYYITKRSPIAIFFFSAKGRRHISRRCALPSASPRQPEIDTCRIAAGRYVRLAARHGVHFTRFSYYYYYYSSRYCILVVCTYTYVYVWSRMWWFSDRRNSISGCLSLADAAGGHLVGILFFISVPATVLSSRYDIGTLWVQRCHKIIIF